MTTAQEPGKDSGRPRADSGDGDNARHTERIVIRDNRRVRDSGDTRAAAEPGSRPDGGDSAASRPASAAATGQETADAGEREAAGAGAQKAADAGGRGAPPADTDAGAEARPAAGPTAGETTKPSGPASTDSGPAASGGLGAELAALRSEIEERTRDLQRITAEYANYRRRVDRDKARSAEEATLSVFRALLPVFDDLDRARAHEELSEGVTAVVDQLTTTAGKFGLTPFGEVGDPFDPTRHEAVAHLTSADVTEPSCFDVLRRGYLLGDRLLRPAMVAVADPAPATDDGAGAGDESGTRPGGPAQEHEQAGPADQAGQTGQTGKGEPADQGGRTGQGGPEPEARASGEPEPS